MQEINIHGISLESWLQLLAHPPENAVFIRSAFPEDRLHDEYLATIDKRSEEEVTNLLRHFLVHSSHNVLDDLWFSTLQYYQKSDPERLRALLSNQYNRRLILYRSGRSTAPTWEGNTWVIDLLPHFPKQALEVLDAYVLAHATTLADQSLQGLFDAMEIIRAKFIGFPENQQDKIQILLDLKPRDFECLIERLYNAMGYSTLLTESQKDGGRDVIATKTRPSQLEHLRIECKRYSGVVTVSIIRALLGVVADEKVNKGVLVTTSRFTKPAKDFAARNPRLELINGTHLILLLNEHLGSRWPIRIERIIAESFRQNSIAT